MGSFLTDTAVTGANGRYVARLSRDWEIWGPNGGYVAAVALRAAGAACGFPKPVSITGHFLSVAAFDDVTIEVHTLRAAKRAASLRVTMSQKERSIFEALVWVADDGAGLQHESASMPTVPAPEGLRRLEDLVPAEQLEQRHRFWRNFEVRPIAYVPWGQRVPGLPEWREWCRFDPVEAYDDRFVDAARSLVLIDTLGWPAACRAHADGHGFVAPSLDVYVQFHRFAPASAWLLIDATAPVATHGLIASHARVWSADGQLLASGGSQMLCRSVSPPTGN